MGVFGAAVFVAGTLLQSLPLVVPGLVLLVILKVHLLTRPVRQLRSRLVELEAEDSMTGPKLGQRLGENRPRDT